MTNQIPTNVTPEDMAHARAYVQDFLDATHGPDRTLAVARVLQALLPTPKRPTLADMTDDERDECKWMQADVYSFDRRMVITEVRTMCADLIERDGERWNVGLERVTPRPDLPRMTWPGDKKPDTVPPNTLAEGSEWDDTDALARACRESGRDQIVVLDHAGGAYVWDEKAEWWEGSAPPQYSPFTILHIGLGSDQ